MYNSIILEEEAVRHNKVLLKI